MEFIFNVEIDITASESQLLQTIFLNEGANVKKMDKSMLAILNLFKTFLVVFMPIWIKLASKHM